MNLTEAEMAKLRNTKNESEWNAVCDEIKAARNGAYPPDWFAKMMMTGLMSAIAATWK
jgi:L-rhamnose mutarotase